MTGSSASDGDALVRTEVHDGIAVLLLNRPAQRNSLRYESWTELAEALQAAGDARGIVIAGAGGFFSAGGDLKTGPAHGDGAMGPAGRVEHAQAVLKQLRAVPVPTIAAVEGAAVGLGWSLVLSCDLVVASRDAFFAAPFVTRAVVPDGGLAWRLTQQLGRPRAASLLLRGNRLPSEDAHRAGLVTDLAEPGSAVDTAVAIAREVAEADAGAVELTKRLLAAVEAAQLASFEPLELAIATVAQQRSAAAAGRAEFG
ncbi:enoyl-CoA hydratase [Mycolicibacterium duvalii]|uniref:Enoyl-CoA hydratase n=1 Tax=Mycolicibacterium duvalii TaxID=39688 RepID=A0A7I7K1X8_9MYCO|nr:enoyl-CoA hydratase/isomerase family protein [Mycolicibacterium duvalii]MCV7370555.1 enoyl-CoA hydratase/isomerase family protein [Mycolicibacterium duvalii]PEG39850.1 enoyl-CoA hydratase [Mycolicibacterium duvalii]BBX18065.1 enoyl-CoA hydratase [Mycolicibacterium duvalii]